MAKDGSFESLSAFLAEDRVWNPGSTDSASSGLMMLNKNHGSTFIRNVAKKLTRWQNHEMIPLLKL